MLPAARSLAPRRSTTPVLGAALLVVATLVSGCGLFDFGDDGARPTLPPPGETNIAYGPAPACPDPAGPDCAGSQTLDIYRSDEPGPNPVLLWFHGGGFALGDKAGVREEFEVALEAGWDIVSVGYRLATTGGANTFPAAVHDAKLAVRWVRFNAEAQDWNPDEIAAIGHSAGGNLVGMLATTAGVPEFEPLPPAGFETLVGVDSSILAAVAITPVSDLSLYAVSDEGSAELVQQYLGCARNCEELLAAGSVQTHVTPETAPMMALYGVDDPLAQPRQGELLADAFEAAGIEDRFELIVVDDGPEQYRGHDPELSRFNQDFVDFLDSHRD